MGSTAGVTAGGHAVVMARFESAEAARANSERPEQGEWWSEIERLYEGEVSFAESGDVDTLLSGGSDGAGFVQFMKGTGVDRSRLQAMDDIFGEHAADFRPDILGGIRVWTGPGEFIEAGYFTSEADAREGEGREPPAAIAEHIDEFFKLMSGIAFFDISDPWFASA